MIKLIKKYKKRIFITILIIVLVFFVFIIGSSLYIELKVKETCENAMKIYPEDKVQALINYIQDTSECNKQKAHALWALGQLGEKSALDFLNKNYSNKNENNICIYEAHFAIKKISEERFNLPAFLWRWTWTK